MSQEHLVEAMDLLKSGGFRMGEAWETAHQICQAHEGDPLFDWVHALVHRIEGDDRNAGYWYRHAGKDRHPGTIEDEWQVIRAAIETG
ncbi:MAG: hypothetical protein KDC18_07950 [Alphaproteobacteria bacterium]|nr:hypothetical protein [Alphaproteobacteria bacterium]MCB9929515.1 hypothetical protein [Alphaproteobacteria bacterium]